MSCRSDLSWSLVVIVLSLDCSFCVAVALPVITLSSLSLKVSVVGWLVVVLGLVLLGCRRARDSSC